MNDEHDGKGGSYIRDPETGERKLAERTVDDRQVQEPQKPAARAVKTTEKGK